jgi:hypothetical protein
MIVMVCFQYAQGKKPLPIGCLVWITILGLVVVGIVASCHRKATAEPVAFQEDLTNGTKVYADITKVEPQYSVHINHQSLAYEYICSCTTESGEKLRLLITVSDYESLFNAHLPEASNDMAFPMPPSNNKEDFAKTSPKHGQLDETIRIYGLARNANDVGIKDSKEKLFVHLNSQPV